MRGLRDLYVIAIAAVATAAVGLPRAAHAVDEIQVYNADIAEIGQWTVEQHLNYTLQGHTQPDFPGGLISNHALNGTPEFAYGIADWWELGFYLPFAVNSGDQFLSNGAKIRNLFVTPHAEKRDFFYGVNFELGYTTPPFSQSRYTLEIRPIIGVRNPDWEFIVNPILDLSFGEYGETDFAPAVRLARNLGEDRFIGVEYYADFGKLDDVLPLSQQSHQLFAVTDFKLADFDVELGLGYGLTPGSDRLVAKAIVGYAFPVPGKGGGESNGGVINTPLVTKAAARQAAISAVDPDVFAVLR